MRLLTLVVFCCIELVLVIFMIARQHNAYINPQKLLTINEDLRRAVNCKNFQGILDNTDSGHQSFTAEDPNCSKLKLPNVANLETDWLNVSRDDLVFVYSAYRETNSIRVIGVAEQSASRTLVLYCQIWARDMSYGVVLFHVKASILLLPESHHLRYGAAYIDCPVSTSSYEPFAVSIVMDEPCITPQNILYLKHKVKIPPRKFTVCFAPLHFNVSFGHMLVNSIEFNQILGADYFVFYNFSLNHIGNKILNYYSKRGLVEVIPWNIKLNNYNIHYYGQMAAVNDCMLRHRHTTNYIVIVDLDEFIIPKDNKYFTWKDILKQLPERSSYSFRHVGFRIDWESPIAGNITDLKERRDIDKYKLFPLKTFEREIDPRIYTWYRCKTILNPRLVNLTGIHRVSDHIEGSHYLVKREDAEVQHYRNRSHIDIRFNSSTETTAIKYKRQLIEKVQSVWQNLREEANN